MSVENEVALGRNMFLTSKWTFLREIRLIRPQMDEISEREFILVKSQVDTEHQMKNQTTTKS